MLDLWPEVVGEQLARVTRVKGMDEAALFVEVRSSAWLMELSMMKEDFLERVNERLGQAPLERIVFVLAETS
jgi:predicted nucleic acid-binding Zn ribbon protein